LTRPREYQKPLICARAAVATAQRGGTFRESFALAKAHTEARGEHGESQLLDELVSEGNR
jgi:hypothetical protein